MLEAADRGDDTELLPATRIDGASSGPTGKQRPLGGCFLPLVVLVKAA